MSAAFWALKRLNTHLEKLTQRGGSVPCWESVDYRCDHCPALPACRDYTDAAGEEHPSDTHS